MTESPEEQDSMAPLIPRILDQITSPHIKEVVLNVRIIRDPSELDYIDWDAVARVLKRPNFSILQRLAIIGVPEKLQDDAKSWMAKRSPLLNARGIICFDEKV